MSFRVGDRVRRRFVPGGREVGPMVGEVVRVGRPRRGAGGVRAHVLVRWANEHECWCEDRGLALDGAAGTAVRLSGGAS